MAASPINLRDPRLCDDPMTVFDLWRSEGKVVRAHIPLLGQVWVTTTYAATAAMLKERGQFGIRSPKDGRVAGMQWWMPRDLRLLSNNMLTSDEPDHTRLRGIVDHAFQRQPVAQFASQVENIASRLADQMAEQDGPVDLVSNFARPLPLAIICELLGLDAAERVRFATNAKRVTGVTGILSLLGALLPLRRMRRQLDALLRARERGKNDHGLLGQLVHLKQEGADIRHDEMVAMAFLLLVAGHETTTHLIAGSVAALAGNPQQRERLLADDEHYDLAVEELLRFVTPVQFSKPRFVLDDMEFFDSKLKRGDRIMACLGAANSDPDHVPDPHRLDLSRRPNPHLAFGTGIHFCLGFQLARLELKTSLRTLLTRFPDMRLNENGIQWTGSLGIRSYKRLEFLLK